MIPPGSLTSIANAPRARPEWLLRLRRIRGADSVEYKNPAWGLC